MAWYAKHAMAWYAVAALGYDGFGIRRALTSRRQRSTSWLVARAFGGSREEDDGFGSRRPLEMLAARSGGKWPGGPPT